MGSLVLPLKQAVSTASPAFEIDNTWGKPVAFHNIAAIVGTSVLGHAVIGATERGESGVLGTAKDGDGVRGESQSGAGVYGLSNNFPAVYGNGGVQGDGSTGVVGNGDGIGIWANGRGNGADGLYASTGGGDAVHGHTLTGRAGYFQGNVSITGSLSKGGGGFKIDHPADPANKYLAHSFVESPEMKNVYDGVVVLGRGGEAEVKLPAYFEALNRDFRYQLTPIGAPAPNLHISKGISKGRFKIAGGQSRMQVSWQVTGIRKDRWAEKNPLIPEEKKPAKQRGFYLHPELYGKAAKKQIEWARNPKKMRRIEEIAQGLAASAMVARTKRRKIVPEATSKQ